MIARPADWLEGAAIINLARWHVRDVPDWARLRPTFGEERTQPTAAQTDGNTTLSRHGQSPITWSVVLERWEGGAWSRSTSQLFEAACL